MYLSFHLPTQNKYLGSYVYIQEGIKAPNINVFSCFSNIIESLIHFFTVHKCAVSKNICECYMPLQMLHSGKIANEDLTKTPEKFNLFEKEEVKNAYVNPPLPPGNKEAKHLHLCYNITCNALPQYLWQGIDPNRMLQEIL